MLFAISLVTGPCDVDSVYPVPLETSGAGQPGFAYRLVTHFKQQTSRAMLTGSMFSCCNNELNNFNLNLSHWVS